MGNSSSKRTCDSSKVLINRKNSAAKGSLA